MSDESLTALRSSCGKTIRSCGPASFQTALAGHARVARHDVALRVQHDDHWLHPTRPFSIIMINVLVYDTRR
jgi:hypothetical protein